jgi:hypothetical protein
MKSEPHFTTQRRVATFVSGRRAANYVALPFSWLCKTSFMFVSLLPVPERVALCCSKKTRMKSNGLRKFSCIPNKVHDEAFQHQSTVASEVQAQAHVILLMNVAAFTMFVITTSESFFYGTGF